VSSDVAGRAKKLRSQLDSDGDGSVSLQEIAQWIKDELFAGTALFAGREHESVLVLARQWSTDILTSAADAKAKKLAEASGGESKAAAASYLFPSGAGDDDSHAAAAVRSNSNTDELALDDVTEAFKDKDEEFLKAQLSLLLHIDEHAKTHVCRHVFRRILDYEYFVRVYNYGCFAHEDPMDTAFVKASLRTRKTDGKMTLLELADEAAAISATKTMFATKELCTEAKHTIQSPIRKKDQLLHMLAVASTLRLFFEPRAADAKASVRAVEQADCARVMQHVMHTTQDNPNATLSFGAVSRIWTDCEEAAWLRRIRLRCLHFDTLIRDMKTKIRALLDKTIVSIAEDDERERVRAAKMRGDSKSFEGKEHACISQFSKTYAASVAAHERLLAQRRQQARDAVLNQGKEDKQKAAALVRRTRAAQAERGRCETCTIM
jgi:hypothetical protein